MSGAFYINFSTINDSRFSYFLVTLRVPFLFLVFEILEVSCATQVPGIIGVLLYWYVALSVAVLVAQVLRTIRCWHQVQNRYIQGTRT